MNKSNICFSTSTYKTSDRLPVQVIKWQHTQHVPIRPVTSCQYIWQHTACTYKAWDRLPVHVTRWQHTCTYKTRYRSLIHVTKLQYIEHMYLQDMSMGRVAIFGASCLKFILRYFIRLQLHPWIKWNMAQVLYLRMYLFFLHWRNSRIWLCLRLCP